MLKTPNTSTKFCWNIEVWAVQKHVNLSRSRQELSNGYFLANIGFDTAEKGLSKFAKSSPNVRNNSWNKHRCHDFARKSGSWWEIFRRFIALLHFVFIHFSRHLKSWYCGVIRAKLDFIVYPYSGGLWGSVRAVFFFSAGQPCTCKDFSDE